MLRGLTLVDTKGLLGYNASTLELAWRISYITRSHFAQLFDHRPA
jgi:hypothetical protein